eukprot:6214276-Pleurochrysis_carterae.AAC.3
MGSCIGVGSSRRLKLVPWNERGSLGFLSWERGGWTPARMRWLNVLRWLRREFALAQCVDYRVVTTASGGGCGRGSGRGPLGLRCESCTVDGLWDAKGAGKSRRDRWARGEVSKAWASECGSVLAWARAGVHASTREGDYGIWVSDCACALASLAYASAPPRMLCGSACLQVCGLMCLRMLPLPAGVCAQASVQAVLLRAYSHLPYDGAHVLLAVAREHAHFGDVGGCHVQRRSQPEGRANHHE